jgi:xylulokinase
MARTLLLGLDIGSSSIKASLVDAHTGELAGSAISPDQEMSIDSPKVGWAEQDPELWYKHVVTATKKAAHAAKAHPSNIRAIGISYQMHGLVVLDKNGRVIHPAIIWCDSRAVDIGNKAYRELGAEYCLSRLLNTPGNFTASKLRWLQENLPEVFKHVATIMLPGDFIALKLSGISNQKGLLSAW